MPEALNYNTGAVATFGDVVQLSRERSKDAEADGFERYLGLEHLEPSDLKVRSWGDIADGTTFTNVFRPGQVLFGKRRAYQRKVAVAEFSGVCSGDIYVLEPRDDRLQPELLPFICMSEPFYDYVISMSQGGLSPRVNWRALAKYEFTLPPLEEQRRIAKALWAAEGARVAHIELVAAAEVATTAVIERILVGREHEFPAQLSDQVDVGGWTRHTLGELCTLGGGHGFKPKDWSKEGLPIIRIQNVRGGKDFNYFDGDPDPDWIVEPGELLFAWAGVPGVSFGPGIWKGPRAVLNQHIFRVTPRPDIDRDWLFEAILYLTPRIERRAHGFKSSLLHIRKHEFTSREILVPPAEQQNAVVRCIRDLRGKQALTQRRVAATCALCASLLDIAGGRP